jgi:hypothetical protein
MGRPKKGGKRKTTWTEIITGKAVGPGKKKEGKKRPTDVVRKVAGVEWLRIFDSAKVKYTRETPVSTAEEKSRWGLMLGIRKQAEVEAARTMGIEAARRAQLIDQKTAKELKAKFPGVESEGIGAQAFKRWERHFGIFRASEEFHRKLIPFLEASEMLSPKELNYYGRAKARGEKILAGGRPRIEQQAKKAQLDYLQRLRKRGRIGENAYNHIFLSVFGKRPTSSLLKSELKLYERALKIGGMALAKGEAELEDKAKDARLQFIQKMKQKGKIDSASAQRLTAALFSSEAEKTRVVLYPGDIKEKMIQALRQQFAEFEGEKIFDLEAVRKAVHHEFDRAIMEARIKSRVRLSRPLTPGEIERSRKAVEKKLEVWKTMVLNWPPSYFKMMGLEAPPSPPTRQRKRLIKEVERYLGQVEEHARLIAEKKKPFTEPKKIQEEITIDEASKTKLYEKLRRMPAGQAMLKDIEEAKRRAGEKR